MNIFYLHENPKTCATYHCDEHVYKMVVETAQMLSTNIRLVIGRNGIIKHKRKGLIEYPYVLPNENPDSPSLYMLTHPNHPSNIWVRESKENFLWLYELGINLCVEYEKRRRKKIITENVYISIKRYLPIILELLPKKSFTPPPQAMPAEFRHEDTITAYKTFYIKDKSRFATWQHTKLPQWYEQAIIV